jgi:hypothetical protein
MRAGKVKVCSLHDYSVITVLPKVGTVRFGRWRTRGAEWAACLHAACGQVVAVDFSADGRFLASAHCAEPHQVRLASVRCV